MASILNRIYLAEGPTLRLGLLCLCLALASATLVGATITFPRELDRLWESTPGTHFEKASETLRYFAGHQRFAIGDPLNAAVSASTSLEELMLRVRDNFFQQRIPNYDPPPTYQLMRYFWFRSFSHIPSDQLSLAQRDIFAFYFDPAVRPKLENATSGRHPHNKRMNRIPWSKPPVFGNSGSSYQYRPAPVRVAIVGGGPAGLVTAISLKEIAGPNVEINVFDHRWTTLPGGEMVFDSSVRRRNQVVTLQRSVLSLLDEGTVRALLGNSHEEIWPRSINLQIREIEDRLLAYLQQRFGARIHLHATRLDEKNLNSEAGDFHVLVGANGANSWLRRTYFSHAARERWRAYGMGMQFQTSGTLPQEPALSLLLTLAQTRYLFNGSYRGKTGYVVVQITEEQWNRLHHPDGSPCTFGNPACIRHNGKPPQGFDDSQVFDPSEIAGDPFWRSLLDGFRLFGFDERHLRGIVRNPVSVHTIDEAVVEDLAPKKGTRTRPHRLVTLVGDAAMTVHYWTGRGMNTALMNAGALSAEMGHAINSEQLFGLNEATLAHYGDFLAKIGLREHEGRNFPLLVQSGDPKRIMQILESAPSLSDTDALELLVHRTLAIAHRLERSRDWPHPPIAHLERKVRLALSRLHRSTLKEMAVSGPWPLEKMSGPPVRPKTCVAEILDASPSLAPMASSFAG